MSSISIREQYLLNIHEKETKDIIVKLFNFKMIVSDILPFETIKVIFEFLIYIIHICYTSIGVHDYTLENSEVQFYPWLHSTLYCGLECSIAFLPDGRFTEVFSYLLSIITKKIQKINNIPDIGMTIVLCIDKKYRSGWDGLIRLHRISVHFPFLLDEEYINLWCEYLSVKNNRADYCQLGGESKDIEIIEKMITQPPPPPTQELKDIKITNCRKPSNKEMIILFTI
jgi:hypothetical protein